MPETFRKRPVEVQAVRWTGDNAAEVEAFAGGLFHRTKPSDVWPDITAEVWDELHSTWVGVKTGQWIIRGVKGEFYPCAADVFDETYERVAGSNADDTGAPDAPGWKCCENHA